MTISEPRSFFPQLRILGALLCFLVSNTACEDAEDREPKGSMTTTGGDAGGSGDGNDDSKVVSEDCPGAANASAQWQALEEEVLEKVNEVRAKGAKCGSKGSFDPAPPLKVNAKLRCAARLHSLDMVKRKFFDHKNPDGESPMQRMKEVGYNGRYAGENIAAGQSTAESVMAGWMKSDGHCANIMNSRYRELGVGYVQSASTKYNHYWTQKFGAK